MTLPVQKCRKCYLEKSVLLEIDDDQCECVPCWAKGQLKAEEVNRVAQEKALNRKTKKKKDNTKPKKKERKL